MVKDSFVLVLINIRATKLKASIHGGGRNMGITIEK